MQDHLTSAQENLKGQIQGSAENLTVQEDLDDHGFGLLSIKGNDRWSVLTQSRSNNVDFKSKRELEISKNRDAGLRTKEILLASREPNHQDKNVVFNLRLYPGLEAPQPQVFQSPVDEGGHPVHYFRYDCTAFEEQSNQFKSRKASSKKKQNLEEVDDRVSTTMVGTVKDDSQEELELSIENDNEAHSGSTKPSNEGVLAHAKALALSESFYQTNLKHSDDQILFRTVTDSKEVSWAFQLFLLNCELELANNIAGRLAPFVGLLCKSVYGNYAIQKLIIRLPVFRKLVEAHCRHFFLELVYNQYSSRVLQLLCEIDKPFAQFSLEKLVSQPDRIVTRIETVFLIGAALRSVRGTALVTAFGMSFLKAYFRSDSVSKGKFSKRVLISLAQNGDEDLLDQLQMLFLGCVSKVKQYLVDKSMMQFLSSMIFKLHKPSLELFYKAMFKDCHGIMKASHSASFFKKVSRVLEGSKAAKDIEAKVWEELANEKNAATKKSQKKSKLSAGKSGWSQTLHHN